MLLTSAALLTAGIDSKSAAAALAPDQRHVVRIEGAVAMMPGTSMLFTYPSDNDPAILVRTLDDRFYAYSQRCSHLGCSVRFDRDLGCFQCPCHLGTYNLESGSVLHGPPRRGLDQIFLQLRGGEVWAVGRSSDYEELIAERNR